MVEMKSHGKQQLGVTATRGTGAAKDMSSGTQWGPPSGSGIGELPHSKY